jgi:predicted CXXCH cytochrome family protein
VIVRRISPALVASIFPIIAGLSACGGNDEGVAPVAGDAGAAYVGAESCAGCHEQEAELWAGSHHDLAMQDVTDDTVLGDFSDTEFAHFDTVTTFSKREGDFIARTDGLDGELTEFPVRYTFGAHPLQQYLVELPDGKLQALSVAWDSRSEEEGGQGWFHVYGDERIDHTDILHWTKLSQNWDTMCADCHSTGLVKRYDIATDTFDTTWSEINVSCEACHGPGSEHVAWARSPDSRPGTGPDKGLVVIHDERHGVDWMLDEKTGNSQRSQPRTTNREINTCAPCHSRRSRIAFEPLPGAELLDGYLPALIQQGLYFSDGQIRDEVYVYGSFLQSRMHRAGVTCGDCHEPHGLTLRAPGSDVCMQCHSAEKFSTVEHQLHAPDSTGADCIGCHMPARTYMQVDPRHDHSFRIPRPSLSVEYGIPNACNGCHTDKSAQWAVEVLRKNDRLPADLSRHWTARLAEADRNPARSRDLLLGLATDIEVPEIIRASAIARLQLGDDALSVALVAERAASSSPMTRWAVARALQTAHPSVLAKYGPPLLDDPVLAVRIAAANALAPLGLETIPVESFPKLQRAIADYLEAQLVSAERGAAHVNIGNLQRKLRRADNSERAYRTAIKVNPWFIPAYVNLADLYRELERESESEAILRQGLEVSPDIAALHQALGLSLVRQGRMGEAVPELKAAAYSDQATARYVLTYALAIDAQGQSDEAIAFLNEALIRYNNEPSLLAALANIYQRQGDVKTARELAERARGSAP